MKAESEPAKPWRQMTCAEARKRIPQRTLPDFWIGAWAGLGDRFASLRAGKARVIGTSPGGRPLHLITYGDSEARKGQANFNSAIGACEPAVYMDKAARRKPVLFFVGPVHGHEVEALTGLVNFMHVLETGADLRGRPQPELVELGRQCRLLIVPIANPDGLARFEPRTLQGMESDDIRFWGQGTWSDDRLCGWPQGKRLHPMKGAQAGFLGCYFDDAGVNPMHDEFFAPLSVTAPALLDVARSEGPDLTVSFHSHGNPPAFCRTAYVPLEIQRQVRALAEQYRTLLEPLAVPSGRVPEAIPDAGAIPPPFNLTSALYHVSGTVCGTFECPHGVRGEKFRLFELEEILDIQLTLYRAMLRFALEGR